MARKVAWPLLIVAGIVGYVIGDNPEERDTDMPPSSVAVVEKSDRASPTQNQTKVAAAPQPQPPPKTGGTRMFVDADRLNVRQGPGLDYKQIWTLKRDEAVSVTGVSGVWRQIRGERYAGWVHGGYLTPKPAPKRVQTTAIKTQPAPLKPSISDSEIRRRLIERSIALYRGSCPCPYNVMRNGRRCGGNSAYSRPGGESPLCYNQDVSSAMVAAYRSRQ